MANVFNRLMIAAAAILGVGSIILFALADHVFPPSRLTAAEALWIDAGLSLFFFVQHSVMVRRSFRRMFLARIDERYHGAIYAIASGVALTIVAVFWQRTPRPLVELHGAARWIAIAFAGFAVAVFVWTAASAGGSFDLLGIKPIRAHMRQRTVRPSGLVVRGPYMWVRHPLYSCVIVLLWSAPVMTADRLLLNALWTAWIVIATLLEERDLVTDFGDAYVSYRRRVPMLVPWRGRMREA